MYQVSSFFDLDLVKRDFPSIPKSYSRSDFLGPSGYMCNSTGTYNNRSLVGERFHKVLTNLLRLLTLHKEGPKL